jgi:phage shock protein C
MSEIRTDIPVEERVDKPQGETPPRLEEKGAPKRLYRSRQDRMIGGVCGGLGQYFNVDPVIVRLIFLLLLLSGPGLLAYIILMIVVPERPIGEPEPAITSSFEIGRGREILALVLVALGLLMLADNLQLYRIGDAGRFWPILLIAAGALILLSRERER